MADNVAITAGSGTTIAADDVAGVLHQRVKTTWGPDGTANDTDVATGKPFPIQVRSATGLIPLGEPTDAKSIATDTTSASAISIWKQISASVQAAAASLAGTLTVTGAGGGGAVTVADGADVTLGAKADAKSTATDTTSISAMSVWKQISASVQAIATSIAATLTTKPASVTLVTLTVKTVTTGGTAVTALTAGQRAAGGWIKNPETATENLGINEIGTASGTSSSGDTTFIVPGITYTLAPSGNAVSVISADGSHPFSGMGYT